jgi:hypothetical protein
MRKSNFELAHHWAQKLLDVPETGIHSWIFARAIFLRYKKVHQNTAVKAIELKARNSRLRRPIQPNEIENSVSNAYSINYEKKDSCSKITAISKVEEFDGQWPKQMPTPKITKNERLIQRVIKDFGTWEFDDITSQSPIEPKDLSSDEILSFLFAPTDLLCMGKVKRFQVLPLEIWMKKKISWEEQIVPNPNCEYEAETKSGRLSGHCRAATGNRKYLVVEFDDEKITKSQQTGLIRFLIKQTGAQLVMLVDSGGKSIHAWFEASIQESMNWKFMNLAVALGADPRMWLPEQFARTPNCKRSNGNLQSCLFLEGGDS